MNEETPLISAKNLSVHFGLGRKLFGEQKVVRAVENISLDIPTPTTLSEGHVVSCFVAQYGPGGVAEASA